jgi:hypothetical protein
MTLVGFRVEQVEPNIWKVWQGKELRGAMYSPDARALAYNDVLQMCRGQMLDHAWCIDPLWLRWWAEGA